MRLLNRIVLTVGLALTVASQAGAVTISLVQIGGTYNGISAVAGDTLTLDPRARFCAIQRKRDTDTLS